jgi:hypothetical protein
MEIFLLRSSSLTEGDREEPRYIFNRSKVEKNWYGNKSKLDEIGEIYYLQMERRIKLLGELDISLRKHLPCGNTFLAETPSLL